MIDITGPDVLSLDAAVKLLPRNSQGKTLNVITPTRWIRRGVRGVKLNGVRLAGRWYTTASSPPPMASSLQRRPRHRLPGPRRSSVPRVSMGPLASGGTPRGEAGINQWASAGDAP
jgi:hypothetical protein